MNYKTIIAAVKPYTKLSHNHKSYLISNTIPHSATKIMVNIDDSTYKAVVALNNSGVTLLQHQRYMEGLLTFKDALILMKNSFQGDDAPSATATSSSLQQHQVNVALQGAWHRTSRMHEDKTISQKADIVVITDHDNPFEVYKALEANRGTFCCIKIDAVEWESCCPDSERFNIESSIIMYNYGIAHLLLSCLSPTTGSVSATWHTQTSYHLFELAYSVIDMHLMASHEFSVPSNVLLVSMLTSTCLYQLSIVAHHDLQSATNLTCLEWIISTIITQERLYPNVSPCAAACA